MGYDQSDACAVSVIPHTHQIDHNPQYCIVKTLQVGVTLVCHGIPQTKCSVIGLIPDTVEQLQCQAIAVLLYR